MLLIWDSEVFSKALMKLIPVRQPSVFEINVSKELKNRKEFE